MGTLDGRRGRTRSTCAPVAWQATPCAAAAPLGDGYRRRAPEKTLLYQLLAREWAAFSTMLREHSESGSGLPQYVEREVLGYLDCGILAKGFARARCRDCRHEMLVAFSCKGRGLCPSCTTRRMNDTAAHLVDRVLPYLPMRQWVLTFPARIRWHLAHDPRLASEVLARVVRALFHFQRRRARRMRIRLQRANANGAVTFIQRFSSALQLNFHLHMLLPDGVFVRPQGDDPEVRPHFVRIEPPTQDEIEQVLRRIIAEVTAWLRKRGRLDDERDQDPDELLPLLHAVAARSPVARSGADVPLPSLCARIEGWSLHAAVAIHQNDREG